MALTTLTHPYQEITVPANTDEHTINYDAVLGGSVGKTRQGLALITHKSGTAIQISTNTIDSAAGTINATVTKIMLDIESGKTLKFKGGAGSEVFAINIVKA